MKNIINGIFILCFLLLGSVSYAEETKVLSLTLDATINPGTADYLISGVRKAGAEKYSAVLINLNTPGGLLPSTQSIVESFLESSVPVLVYVSPSGGGAISAGVFITLAAHIAGMAPGTNIGAAHPVTGGGQDIDGDMRTKVENFASSLIKAIAEQRGRNITWAEKAVKESVALTDVEAVRERVVDFTASNEQEFFKMASGRHVKVKGKEIEIPDLTSSRVDIYEMSLRHEVVNIVSDPSIASLLGVGAFGGIAAEFYNPGLIVPGTIGVLCLILTLVASQSIPINTGGVLLLAFGGILIIAETFVPSFGVLGVVGLICLILGSVYVVDTSMIWAVDGFGLDTEIVAGSALFMGLLILALGYLASKNFGQKVVTGKEGLIERIAEVKTNFVPSSDGKILRGKVFVMGELWNAEKSISDQIPKVGDQVKVVEVEGIKLIVE